MAMVSLEALREYIGTTGTASDSLITAAGEAAEREILNFCHRSSDWTGFVGSTGTRYYDASSIIDLPEVGTVLWLGDADLQSVNSLTNGDDSTINSTSYRLCPRNRKPYRYIQLLSNESWSFDTDGEIEIAGTWGYSTAADAAIQDYVKQTAKYKLDLRASQTFDVTASPDIGVITIPKGMPANVKLGLEKGGYVRVRGAL